MSKNNQHEISIKESIGVAKKIAIFFKKTINIEVLKPILNVLYFAVGYISCILQIYENSETLFDIYFDKEKSRAKKAWEMLIPAAALIVAVLSSIVLTLSLFALVAFPPMLLPMTFVFLGLNVLHCAFNGGVGMIGAAYKLATNQGKWTPEKIKELGIATLLNHGLTIGITMLMIVGYIFTIIPGLNVAGLAMIIALEVLSLAILAATLLLQYTEIGQSIENKSASVVSSTFNFARSSTKGLLKGLGIDTGKYYQDDNNIANHIINESSESYNTDQKMKDNEQKNNSTTQTSIDDKKNTYNCN